MSLALKWLVEYVEAVPCPVYTTDDLWPTCDPWAAKRFETEEEAAAWMIRPGIVGYQYPWAPTHHGFCIGGDQEIG
jgi:hypothetical protein